MQLRCEIVTAPWSRLLSGLWIGRYDMLVSSTPISSVLAPTTSFSDKYYSLAALLLCCGSDPAGVRTHASFGDIPWAFLERQGADLEITPAAVAGKRIGILRWGNYGELLDDALPKTVLVPYDTLEAALDDLKAGRLDLLFDDRATLTKVLSGTDADKDFQLAGLVLAGPPMLARDAGIAVRPEDSYLLPTISRALQAMRADGTYKTLNDRYFDFDVYGS
jgi:arginine/ornithine transport system substrate-binding protein